MDYDYITIFRAAYNEGDEDSLQRALEQMKILGASQLACVKVLKLELPLTLAEADHLVLCSRAWAKDRKDTEAFREHLFHLADKLNARCIEKGSRTQGK